MKTNDMREINDKYNKVGGEHGFLGRPDDDERFCSDGVGRYRQFKHGSIHWHPSTGAYETHGAIRGKWAQMQFEVGPLGYPISDEHDVSETELADLLPPGSDPTLAARSVNRCSEFEHGKTFCWSPDTRRYFTTVITSDGYRTDEAHIYKARKITNEGTALTVSIRVMM
jgi:LGFP repeat